jgi:hypothetical protein
MDRGLTNARDLAERVLGYTGGAGAPEVDAAAAAIVDALEELGRVVTSVHTTRSAGELVAASSSLAQAGNPKLSPGLAGAFRAWPTAEARRRHDPTWEQLLQLDALEARRAPRDAVRLLRSFGVSMTPMHGRLPIPESVRPPLICRAERATQPELCARCEMCGGSNDG